MQEKSQKTHTILVIEDNQDMLQLIGRILQSEGYGVLLAADGVYGLTMLRKASPDLVLLDIMMPGPDGYSTLQSIRRYCNVPVIMVTAKWDKEAVQKASVLGADSYVKKPFSPGELLTVVEMHLQRT